MFTGMRGVFMVAAELAKRRYIVSPTSRSAAGADLLATDERCTRSFAIQVKTNAVVFSWFTVNKDTEKFSAPTYFYVLVNIRKDRTDFYVVPSEVVARNVTTFERKNSTWYGVALKSVEQYKDKWELFEKVS